jgi:putative hydrolase of the HAD superfamily
MLMMDVDGVLVRSHTGDGRDWSADLESDLGLRADELHQAFFVPHWKDVVLGRASLADRLAMALAVVAPHLTAERLIDYWFSRDARLDTALLSDLGAIRRRGVGVHLATNQEHMRAAWLMQVLGLSQHVDAMHYSADLGVSKPDPVFFRRIAERVQRAPDDLLLIDDSLANVEAARTVGWSAIRWTADKQLADVLRPHLAV